MSEHEKILREFVLDINATGGIVYDENAQPAPALAPDWLDLGMTYLKACKALKIKPEVSEE